MVDDTFVFECLIHAMEIGVVIGIGVVIWFIQTKGRKQNDAGSLQQHNSADARPDRD